MKGIVWIEVDLSSWGKKIWSRTKHGRIARNLDFREKPPGRAWELGTWYGYSEVFLLCVVHTPLVLQVSVNLFPFPKNYADWQPCPLVHTMKNESIYSLG